MKKTAEKRMILRKTGTFLCITLSLITLSITSKTEAKTTTGRASAAIVKHAQIAETQGMYFDIGPRAIKSQNAHFSASGTRNGTFTLSLETRSNKTMALKNFTHSAGTTPTFDKRGIAHFDIGADLEMINDLSAPDRSSMYQMTVNYQ